MKLLQAKFNNSALDCIVNLISSLTCSLLLIKYKEYVWIHLSCILVQKFEVLASVTVMESELGRN